MVLSKNFDTFILEAVGEGCPGFQLILTFTTQFLLKSKNMLLVDTQKEDKERADVWNNTVTVGLPFYLPLHDKQSTG